MFGSFSFPPTIARGILTRPPLIRLEPHRRTSHRKTPSWNVNAASLGRTPGQTEDTTVESEILLLKIAKIIMKMKIYSIPYD